MVNDAAVETGKAAIDLLPPGPSSLRTSLENSLAKYLIEQKSYAEAEPLLLALHQQLDDNPGSPASQKQLLDKQKQESIERIIRLYESWHTDEPGEGHDANAAEWRDKLEKVEDSRLKIEDWPGKGVSESLSRSGC